MLWLVHESVSLQLRSTRGTEANLLVMSDGGFQKGSE